MSALTIAKLRGVKPIARGGVKHLCPVCVERKYPREFRQSRNDLRRNTICLSCRRRDPQAERRFYETGINSQPASPAEQRKILEWLTAFYERRIAKGKEVNRMAAETQAAKTLNFPERVAAIIGKTHVVCGDDSKLDDYEALTRIRDLLEELDPHIIARNKNKRLSRG